MSSADVREKQSIFDNADSMWRHFDCPLTEEHQYQLLSYKVDAIFLSHIEMNRDRQSWRRHLRPQFEIRQ